MKNDRNSKTFSSCRPHSESRSEAQCYAMIMFFDEITPLFSKLNIFSEDTVQSSMNEHTRS